MSLIVAVPDAATSSGLGAIYSSYSGGVVERRVICPMRHIPSGNAHLGGISQPLIMSSPIAGGVTASFRSVMDTAIVATGRATQ